jgi:Glycosyl transferase family 2
MNLEGMNLECNARSQSQLDLPLHPMRHGVSIVINNYNYGHFLRDAIVSALEQDSASCEVIVVDDGSTDYSREVIAEFGNRVVPVLKPNGGQASAFNAGFAASSGEWICFLDADDVVRSQKAKVILQTALEYPEAEWIFHILRPVQADLNPIVAVDDLPEMAYPMDVRKSMAAGQLNYQTFPFPIPATSGLCIRRSRLSQMLPMPESDGISLNDSYLQYAALGTSPGIFLAQALACQRYHDQNAFVKTANPALSSRIFMLTAYWLRHHFPVLDRFSQSLLACSLTERWRSGQSLPPTETQQFQQMFSRLSVADRAKLYSKAIYYYLRSS